MTKRQSLSPPLCPDRVICPSTQAVSLTHRGPRVDEECCICACTLLERSTLKALSVLDAEQVPSTQWLSEQVAIVTVSSTTFHIRTL